MVQLYRRMAPRDIHEPHRVSTHAELFFDLTFAVAVSQAASSLQHSLIARHFADAFIGFPLAFSAVWWAWMNFTWFASAYDTDDALYRVMTLVQMTGVLVVAAGIPRVYEGRHMATMVVGYVVMRVAMAGQWLRAGLAHRAGRRCALRYASGITAVQAGWVGWLAVRGPAKWAVLGVLGVVELAIPIWAEAAGRTSWHPTHIAERYSLFTLIVLGESVLAATIGVQAALDTHASLSDLATVICGGLLVVFAMWWTYFDLPTDRIASSLREQYGDRLTPALRWGYGHFFLFAGAAATGAGLEVAVDQAIHRSGLSRTQAGLASTVPVALFLFSTWAVHRPFKRPGLLRTVAVLVAVALVIGCSVTGEAVLGAGLIVVVLLVVSSVDQAHNLGPAQ